MKDSDGFGTTTGWGGRDAERTRPKPKRKRVAKKRKPRNKRREPMNK